jgi:hypothetical protein
MKLALITVVLATLTAASVSQAQGQHSAPAVAPHVAPAPIAAVAPAARTTTAHTSGSHHVAASSNGASNSTHARTTSARPAGSYTPWPAGSHFTGPVSPGGFTNPLAGTNKGNHGSKGSTGIILLGGGYGYGYGYGYDPSADDSQASDQQADDQESGGQQTGGQQQPQYIFVQQVPDPRGQSMSSASGDQSQNAPEQQPAEPVVPLRDVGSFTLVTQAGYRLDAVAFTRSADRLVYITPDGGRRSIAFRDLDVAATQRLNTERGTPITIPPADDTAPPANPKTKASSEIVN